MATKRENDVLKEKCSVFWDNYFLHFAFLYFPNFCFLKEKKKMCLLVLFERHSYREKEVFHHWFTTPTARAGSGRSQELGIAPWSPS